VWGLVAHLRQCALPRLSALSTWATPRVLVPCIAHHSRLGRRACALTDATHTPDSIESQRRKRQIKEGDRLSTPSPRQVRTLLERSNASAIRSMYKIQMDFPYSPGRTLDQRSQDALRKFFRAFYRIPLLPDTLPCDPCDATRASSNDIHSTLRMLQSCNDIYVCRACVCMRACDCAYRKVPRATCVGNLAAAHRSLPLISLSPPALP